MCYSAMVKADFKKYQQMFGATMGIAEFHDLSDKDGVARSEDTVSPWHAIAGRPARPAPAKKGCL